MFEKDDRKNLFVSEGQWYAVWTRSRQEKSAAKILESIAIPHFLPLKAEVRQWSDRRRSVEVPLFTSYLFVRITLSSGSKLKVLKTPGVVSFVGNQTGPLPIAEEQIRAIRTVLAERVDCSVLPLFEGGDKVRVKRGPLTGLEGRLTRINSSSRILISIEMIHRTLAVSVSRDDVELIPDRAA